MHLTFSNVNDAFVGIVHGIHTKQIPTVETSSRNGPVLQIPEPVIITYLKPVQRVLFNINRDANPFFHLYEALWMLAGRNDAAPPAYYASNMRNYSDDGITLNGAYGYRWRNSVVCIDQVRCQELQFPDHARHPVSTIWEVDQLQVLIDQLKQKPDSRRAVLQMWNVEDDLLRIDSSRDVCCNLSACFSIRQETLVDARPQDTASGLLPIVARYLDMTVFNRSNDLIWGTLGANAVHFSVLQEYLAACLGVGVGVYHQISNNQHVYKNNWKPEHWLDGLNVKKRTMFSPPILNYSKDVHVTVPLVQSQEQFDKEVPAFVEQHLAFEPQNGKDMWQEPFLMDVAKPMCHTFHMHKQRDYSAALEWISRIKSDDWRLAALNWINKRRCNWERKQNKKTAAGS